MNLYLDLTNYKKTLKHEINFYKITRNICQCYYLKDYYNQIIILKLEELSKISFDESNYTRIPTPEINLTLEELADYNGINGKPAYIAVEETIYDVSLQETWGGGSHFSLLSGKDLSREFTSCHNDTSILSKLPIIGKIVK